jgi:argonaute-like protein implicated in RNA metabolism and viral defense
VFKIIKQLLFITVILLISGCGTSNISYQNEQLSLQINKSHLQVHGTQVDQRKENFSTLFLTKNLLRLNDGSLIVYEDARTDMQYQFDPTATRSIDIIFDAKRVVKVYYNALIYAFQVVLKDNRVLNVLATQSYDQELKMVYGMSTEKLNSMLKNLDPNAKPVHYNNVINLSHEPTPFMSRWTTWKVHFVPLVVPLRRIGRL